MTNQKISLAVYDTEEKKLVLIARDTATLADWAFTGIYINSFINFIQRKTKNKTNVFKRSIAVRVASIEQLTKLEEYDLLILDDKYDKNQKLSRKTIKRDYEKLK